LASTATPETAAALRERASRLLGPNAQSRMARGLNKPLRTVQTWFQGLRPVPPATSAALDLIELLMERGAELPSPWQ
jgi:hypothetical protein